MPIISASNLTRICSLSTPPARRAALNICQMLSRQKALFPKQDFVLFPQEGHLEVDGIIVVGLTPTLPPSGLSTEVEILKTGWFKANFANASRHGKRSDLYIGDGLYKPEVDVLAQKFDQLTLG